MKNHRAPLIVALVFVLLLLPLVYVGSYLALVVPATFVGHLGSQPRYPYRWGGAFAARLFWPLEQIDRMVRPEPWRLMVGMDFLPPRQADLT